MPSLMFDYLMLPGKEAVPHLPSLCHLATGSKSHPASRGHLAVSPDDKTTAELKLPPTHTHTLGENRSPARRGGGRRHARPP